MKKILIGIFFTLSIFASEATLAEITVEATNITPLTSEGEVLQMQETSPGLKQPVIDGLMGDKILITLDGNRFTNAMFRSGPNQYYSWVPDDFVLYNSINDTLLNNSLGGTIERKIGISENEFSVNVSENTFHTFLGYGDETLEFGVSITENGDVVTPEGKVEHSDYNQKGIYLGLNTIYGKTKFIFSESDDIPRNDKFQKGDYYVFDLQRYVMISHTYNIPNTNIVIQPSYQHFNDSYTYDKKNDGIDVSYNKNTNDILGLNVSNFHRGLIQTEDVFSYGLTEHYEDLQYQENIDGTPSKNNKYYYNTLSVWTKYNAPLSKNWDYTITYNFSWMKTKGDNNIDKSMTGSAFGISTKYKYTKDGFIYSSINTNFKFPTITDLAEARKYDSIPEVSNAFLTKEQALTYRIGIFYQGAELSLFYKEVKDMITREYIKSSDGYDGTDIYVNADGRIKGISIAYNRTIGEVDLHLAGEYVDAKTYDYGYLSKVQPITLESKITYFGGFVEWLYAPEIPEDKMAYRDFSDIRTSEHHYGYNIVNFGYIYNYKDHEFSLYLDNAFDNRGRVYGSAVDFNERRLRAGYKYNF